ncbi:hypothetical protein ACFWAY_51865 [Rhodococcus sp. NPDC059968]|uniref:hypothetical protein n=1 Tax=Rhodococcus sp. NPDC059968 TaxID=3347017 RepID=UPI00366F6F94
MAVPLLLRAREGRDTLIAVAIAILGLILWCAQDNGHGLVAAYGCALGGIAWMALGDRLIYPERDLHRPARITMGTLEAALGKR